MIISYTLVKNKATLHLFLDTLWRISHSEVTHGSLDYQNDIHQVNV
jgi:hypothetical protein